MKQLDHQACETFERSGDTDCRVDFYEDTLGGLDVDLEFSGFVDGRVEEG